MSIPDEAATLVGEAWDDGNAMGLDGYVGPNRGAGDVDPEAKRARERMVDRVAALPFLQPQPVDRPLLDRKAVADRLLYEEGSEWADGTDRHYELADAVMELARPMPTREQLEKAMTEELEFSLGRGLAEPAAKIAAGAVLALLGGVDESGKS